MTGTVRPAIRMRLVYGGIGLVYLVYPLADALDRHGWRMPVGIGAVIVFAALYLVTSGTAGPWSAPPRRLTYVLLTACYLLGVGLVFLNGGRWAGLYVYLAILAATCLPERWIVPAVLATTALGVGNGFAVGASALENVIFALSTGGIGIFMMTFRHSRTLNHQLQQAQQRVAALAATEERLRIARDLHDLLGHSLSLIVLKTEIAQRLEAQQPGRALREVGDIQAVARQALADVRETVSDYRRRRLPEEIDNARAALDAAGVALTIHVSGTALPATVDTLFGWAVREAVTNVIRHADAARATIAVDHADACAGLTVSNDGTTRPAVSVPGSGNGLAGLRERVLATGGRLTAEPLPEGGFQVSVTVPLGAP